MRAIGYFAYGSNMLAERLRARCPGASPVGVAVAEDHALVWDKLGVDGSGKCGIVERTEAAVPGVIFEIALEECDRLDGLEGASGNDPGYRRDDAFIVMGADGNRFAATTYLPVAGKRRAGLPVYDWYRALVLAGAMQHRLDARHVEAIAGVPAVADPEPRRARRLEALAALGAAGYARLLDEPA